MKIKHVERNIDRTYTDIPVKTFMARPMGQQLKIGGLLDYGYSESQIATMLHIPIQGVMRTMAENHYKTIDKLKVEYED